MRLLQLIFLFLFISLVAIASPQDDSSYYAEETNEICCIQPKDKEEYYEKRFSDYLTQVNTSIEIAGIIITCAVAVFSVATPLIINRTLTSKVRRDVKSLGEDLEKSKDTYLKDIEEMQQKIVVQDKRISEIEEKEKHENQYQKISQNIDSSSNIEIMFLSLYYKAPIDFITYFIENIGKTPTALNLRGMAYARDSRYGEAVSDYKEALELSSESEKEVRSYVYNNLGSAYNNMGNYSDAIKEFNNAIKLNPTYALAYHNLGYSYRKTTKYIDAEVMCSKAIELYNKESSKNPSLLSDSYLNRAATYRELGNFVSAKKDIDEAERLDKNNAWVYNSRGILYRIEKNYTKALDEFERAKDISEFPEIYDSCAEVLMLSEKYNEALACCISGLKLPSVSPNTKSMLEEKYSKCLEHIKSTDNVKKS